jgi:hypothetical protein
LWKYVAGKKHVHPSQVECNPLLLLIKRHPREFKILKHILRESEGEKVARRIDETIAKLPGLVWFNRLTLSRAENLKRLSHEQAPAGAVALPSS